MDPHYWHPRGCEIHIHTPATLYCTTEKWFPCCCMLVWRDLSLLFCESPMGKHPQSFLPILYLVIRSSRNYPYFMCPQNHAVMNRIAERTLNSSMSEKNASFNINFIFISVCSQLRISSSNGELSLISILNKTIRFWELKILSVVLVNWVGAIMIRNTRTLQYLWLFMVLSGANQQHQMYDAC